MGTWLDELPITDSRALPPDPELMKSLGLNHALESAVADLVDNSVDAGARKILIRFMRDQARLVGLYVVDDGRGMGPNDIDQAMTLGQRREYSDNDLGHFGVGLKAASLGQANSLTVLSRNGTESVGRRWLIEKATKKFECDVVDPRFAADTLDRDWGFVQPTTGTVVRWDQVRTFPQAQQARVTDRFLEDAILRVRQHLGLVFHRFIDEGRVQIAIDVEDHSLEDTGPLFLIEATDPFAYLRTGHPAYPRALNLDAECFLTCHIWPGRSQLPAFRLPGGLPDKFQGMYFYRGDRLLQVGGWNGLTHPEKKFQLARVSMDIDNVDASLFAMNPEKTRLDLHESLVRAILDAREPDGFSFNGFLDDATAAFKEARKRDKSRRRVFPPGKGLSRTVRRVISKELEFLPGESPVEIKWSRFEGRAFFDIDRDDGVIWLNKRYRAAINRDRGGSLNDAPLVKTLLYLLVEDLFHGTFLGAKDKDNIELWQSILTTAAEEELNAY